MGTISEWLLEDKGFKRFFPSKLHGPDTNRFSCVRKISPIHFLYYSDDLGYFTLAQNHESQVNHIASAVKVWFTYIMIPRLARTREDCEIILNTFITGQTFL